MDPCSITASLTALFAAVRVSAKTLSIVTQDFRYPTVDILPITISIMRLEEFLVVVEGAFGTEGSSKIENPHTTQALAVFLKRTLDVLNELHIICSDASNHRGGFRYLYRLRTKIQPRVKKLSDSVDGLATLVAVLAM